VRAFVLVGTARELLLDSSYWKGFHLPTLQVNSSGMCCSMIKVICVALIAVTFSCSVEARAQGEQDFPEGPGKETLLAMCGACHDANRVRAGYTPEGWRTVMRMMLNFSVPVPSDQVDPLTQYLITNFPERPRPAAVIVDGPVQVSIKLWQVRTPGSRPHDPMAAKDGSIWYTGQLSNKLGRVDPRTSDIREYAVKTPQTAPHGLAQDKDGNVWFTGNHLGLIGKFDPATGNVTEYRMPDPKAKDPHSIAIDQNGTVWFTAQNANMLGRLDPHSGEIKLVHSPTPSSRPYGIMINSKGVPIFVEFGSNKIASIDPATMAIREYGLPHAASRPRRLALTPDDVVWYSDFARGYLGRLDLATGEHKEWLSPSGPQSRPYGMIVSKGAIWYNESFAKPNTIVRFDPKTEKFQSWAVPGGGDIVRNMDVTRDGNPVTAHSLVNAVGMIELK
jgi:virginiamycin B lyase